MRKSIIPYCSNPERIGYLLFPAILSASFALCYISTFIWLHHKYQGGESYYSHGYLIPLVSAYLIFRQKNRLSAMPLSSAPIGLLIIVISLAVHVFGVVGDVNFVSAFSLVMYLIGCSLFFLGKDITKAIAFPLFFLFFLCPLPDAYLDVVALPLKSMATTFSLSVIDLTGIPCMREGFRLHLPGSIFIVGTPCNGLRSLIALSTVGFLFVYFLRSSWWKKLFFLSLILPVAIVLNGLRISALLLISYAFGQEAASPESLLHDGSGIVVFLIGLMALMLAGRGINNEEKQS